MNRMNALFCSEKIHVRKRLLRTKKIAHELNCLSILEAYESKVKLKVFYSSGV